MTIQKFTSQFISRLEKELRKGETVQAVKQIGNNGIQNMSLILSRDGKEGIRINNIERYYKLVKSGMNPESIVADILRLFCSQSNIKVLDGNRNDFSSVSSRITYRLIHYGKNIDELKDKAYIPWQEFAITFYIIEIDAPYGIYSVPVTKEDMKIWDASTKELYQTAAKRTPLLLPLQINSLREMIGAGIGPQLEIEDLFWGNASEIMILSNCQEMYGASVILYEGTLKEVAISFNRDFYLVPLSIHEILVVSSQYADPDELREWHRSSLQFLQDKEHWLSDEIYLYRQKYEDLIWVPENRLFS